MIGVDVQGVEELERKLNSLAYAGASRASAKGIRAGLKVLEKAQKAAAPVGTAGRVRKGKVIIPGGMKRSIRSRFLKSGKGPEKGMQTAKAGLNVGRKRRDPLRAPHGHLYTLGTKQRRTKSGANRGVMPARPFIAQASRAVENEAIQAVATVTAREIEREAAKLK